MGTKIDIRPGRPKAGTADDMEERLLARVWHLYVAGGYANVSYDAIAAAERMSKRTIYTRYADKMTLFRAAVARQIERAPKEYRAAVETRSREPISAFVEFTLRSLLTPDSRAMNRITRGEEGRFPDLAELARQNLDWAVSRLTQLLEGRLTSPDRDIAEIARCIVDVLLGRTSYAPVHMSTEETEHYVDEQLPRLLRLVQVLTGGAS